MVGTAMRQPTPLCSAKPAGSGGGVNDATRACLERLHPGATVTIKAMNATVAARSGAFIRDHPSAICAAA